MTKHQRTYYTCDDCNGEIKGVFKITRGKKHFCTTSCEDNYDNDQFKKERGLL